MFEVGDVVKCIHSNEFYPSGETVVTDVTNINGNPAIKVENSGYKALIYRYELVSRAKEITEEDLKGLV